MAVSIEQRTKCSSIGYSACPVAFAIAGVLLCPLLLGGCRRYCGIPDPGSYFPLSAGYGSVSVLMGVPPLRITTKVVVLGDLSIPLPLGWSTAGPTPLRGSKVLSVSLKPSQLGFGGSYKQAFVIGKALPPTQVQLRYSPSIALEGFPYVRAGIRNDPRLPSLRRFACAFPTDLALARAVYRTTPAQLRHAGWPHRLGVESLLVLKGYFVLGDPHFFTSKTTCGYIGFSNPRSRSRMIRMGRFVVMIYDAEGHCRGEIDVQYTVMKWRAAREAVVGLLGNSWFTAHVPRGLPVHHSP